MIVDPKEFKKHIMKKLNFDKLSKGLEDRQYSKDEVMVVIKQVIAGVSENVIPQLVEDIVKDMKEINDL